MLHYCFQMLDTFMAIGQKTGAGSNPRNSRVVSKPDRDHSTANTATDPWANAGGYYLR